MSRASILFWRSAVSWCRASCKTLGTRTNKRQVVREEAKAENSPSVIFFCITPQHPLPQLLEGLVCMLLQNLLHSFNQRHFFFQLLVYGVSDKLVPSPSVPQCQAFTTDLQGNVSRSQGLLGLLFRLSQHTSGLRSLHCHFSEAGKFVRTGQSNTYMLIIMTVIYRRAATFSLNFKMNDSENIDTYCQGNTQIHSHRYTSIYGSDT